MLGVAYLLNTAILIYDMANDTDLIVSSDTIFHLPCRMLLVVNSIILGVSTLGLLIKAIITNDLVDRSEAMDIFTLTASALYKMWCFHNHHKEIADIIQTGAILNSRLPPKWSQYTGIFSVLHCSLGMYG